MMGGDVVYKDELDNVENEWCNFFQSAGRWRQEGTLSACKIHIHGGIFEYAPNADPVGLAPWFYVDGVLDVTEAEYAIPVGALVIGPNGEVRGSAIETVGSKTDFDMRQDYP